MLDETVFQNYYGFLFSDVLLLCFVGKHNSAYKFEQSIFLSKGKLDASKEDRLKLTTLKNTVEFQFSTEKEKVVWHSELKKALDSEASRSKSLKSLGVRKIDPQSPQTMRHETM